MCSVCNWDREPDEEEEDDNLATLTPEQDVRWQQAFDYWLNVEGTTEEKADEYAWEDLVKEYPELAKFEGCRP